MSRDRERQAMALVACPTCQAPAGQPCRDNFYADTVARVSGRPVVPPDRPWVHGARRDAWQAARPRDAVTAADITMSDQKEGAPGRWHTYVMLAPLTARGRAALPDGPTRVEHPQVRATLARLRGQGLIVMRED
jgi:hypothetical protein